MSRHGRPDFYSCDNCGRELHSSGEVLISTSKSEQHIYWERLRVTIERYHGSHNSGERDPADLCKACAVTLLKDALKRVQAGERVTAGVVAIEQLGFEGEKRRKK